FHGLDVATTQLYRGPRFLRGVDDDVRNVLASEMKGRGVDLRFESNVASIEKVSGGLRASLEDGSVLDTDAILYATGRVPRTRGLGLEEAGVALDEKGAVSVDAFSRSSVPSIWAIGDVTDRINLTPVAIHEGICVAKTLFGGVGTKSDHTNVASAVFSQPSIGTVGPSEAAARETYGEIDVYRSTFRALKHTLTGRDEQTMMKLIVDRASDRVVSLHMVGADAGEIIQGFTVALKCGATKAQFDATIGIHPTSAEEFVTMRDPV
ncbi:MAG: FAD-dependent oxidoreductase, partial [Myxococcales bacterium]|nr:FAD-dependent oxidoreductase [Myxococcales bacterium]